MQRYVAGELTMKRLLGLIGLTYLSVLVVVFYFESPILILVLTSLSVISLGTGIFFKVIKTKEKLGSYLLTLGITAICAITAIILYANINHQPLMNNYSYKEITIEGYICEESQKSERSCTYTILADNIDGKSENIKIQLTSYTDLNLDEFERIKTTVTVQPVSANYQLSKGIFFKAYADEDFILERTGETEFSLYNFAIDARKTMKQSLDALLPNTYSSLCKAVLLGDKQALSYEVKSYFSLTGTSFLIVVSGMHLSIIVSVILFLLKKITKNRMIICISVFITVFSFMSITGFTPSVIRSGVMIVITYCANLFFRKSDALNSLGIAALILTIFNPYSVGDIGMLLSFAATMGIILWSNPINSYINRKLHIKGKFLEFASNLISVSISASLWIMPISVLAFGRVSPLVVIISFITEPIVSAILVLALISSLLFICPIINFMAYPFALAAGLLCKLQLWIISSFAAIPYCSVNADTPYFYIWTAVTVLLVIIGYIIKAKPFYIKTATAFSFVTLLIGWAVYVLTGYNTTVNIYNTDYGVTASVECGYNITLISCGGSVKNESDITEDISNDFVAIDNIIIPQQKNKYSKYLPSFLSEFDVSNILVYDSNSENQKLYEAYDGNKRTTFGNNIAFTINLNNSTTDEIINIDGITYQYIKSDSKTMLFAPTGADIAKLPEKYRKADYLLIDNLPENYNLLDCKEIIYSGKDEYFKKNENSFKEISHKIQCTNKGNIQLEF